MKRAAKEQLPTFVLWTPTHRHKDLFTALQSDVCLRCERVLVVKMCVSVHVQGFRGGVRASAPPPFS